METVTELGTGVSSMKDKVIGFAVSMENDQVVIFELREFFIDGEKSKNVPDIPMATTAKLSDFPEILTTAPTDIMPTLRAKVEAKKVADEEEKAAALAAAKKVINDTAAQVLAESQADKKQ